MKKKTFIRTIQKAFLIIFIFTLFTQCFYKDYTFKESLDRNFYLMESDILPSKYICIEHENGSLVLLYDLLEVAGNENIILVKNKNKENKDQYNLIKIAEVVYPEDIKVISYDEYSKRKKQLNYDYSYDQKNGFWRKFKWHK
ncbi:hypothetical protein [Flavobacterium ajazii]|uniref:hypothetical protein n=1 Tax=Flavobacterium ajazii TaxID=2692318 RepID=UPI0013D44AA9|nr:hypothetical protein [Flavobacterium ajazii]